MRYLSTVLTAVVLCLSMLQAPQVHAAERLRLATTTSTENSGLLAYLLPHFEERCGCKVDVIAVGTGQALKLGSHGDVDVVLVHAPDAELAFVANGYGVDRRTFMQNDFVVVGSPTDPAGIRGQQDAALALEWIARAQATFVSRGDQSGTHIKELAVWRKAEIAPAGSWYLEVGQGMGAVLTMTDNKQAYTLTDRGTFLARSEAMALEVLVEGDPVLINPYSIMAPNPELFPWVKYGLASQLIDWLCSPEGQLLIGQFTVRNTTLFHPTVIPVQDP